MGWLLISCAGCCKFQQEALRVYPSLSLSHYSSFFLIYPTTTNSQITKKSSSSATLYSPPLPWDGSFKVRHLNHLLYNLQRLRLFHNNHSVLMLSCPAEQFTITFWHELCSMLATEQNWLQSLYQKCQIAHSCLTLSWLGQSQIGLHCSYFCWTQSHLMCLYSTLGPL